MVLPPGSAPGALRATMRKFLVITCFLLTVPGVRAQVWTPLGPPGGDARVLAADPQKSSRVFLGTADGHIFGSQDSGAHWTLLGRASSRIDAVITAIVVDPLNANVLLASSWARNSPDGGGIFRSEDGGHIWAAAGLGGQSVRVLTMAPSDSSVLVAGTLDGVYLSRDGSKTWQRISPEHDPELRNFDALAIDPRDPQTIYAGTFHLPWKTTDGGRTWNPVHAGMIDDSDVMSLLIDARDSQRIFASACSGIYRSDDRAAQWRKIQGIPYAARRTYAIAQDPREPDRVYAATSEGLWKTDDGGLNWRRTTSDSLVVNSVIVTEGSPGRVLIGTDGSGVLASEDGGEHFQETNVGFNHRQILALGLDAKAPGRVLAVLGQSADPVLVSSDKGRTWSPLGAGFPAEPVLRVYAAPDGAWWASLGRGGLMRYEVGTNAWTRTGTLRLDPANARAALSSPHATLRAGSNGPPPRGLGRQRRKAMPASTSLAVIVVDMAFSTNQWYAATNEGLLVSKDLGATWIHKPLGPLATMPVQAVRVSADGLRIRVVSQRGLVFSDDAGKAWRWHDLPLESGGATAVAVAGDSENTLLAMAHNGLYISRDFGGAWERAAAGLPAAPVLAFAASGPVFAAAMQTGGLYISGDSGRTWDRVPGALSDARFTVVESTPQPGVFFVAADLDGVYRVQWRGHGAEISNPATPLPPDPSAVDPHPGAFPR